MKLVDGQKASAEVLTRDSVNFDVGDKWNNQKAWPFWYSFIPYPFGDTDTLNNGLGLLGIEILPGQTKNINIQIEQDTVYRLINLKYSAYNCREQTEGAGTITLATDSLDVVAVGGDFETIFPVDPDSGERRGILTYVGATTGLLRCVSVASVTDDDNLVLADFPPEAAAGVAWGSGEFIYHQTTAAGVDIPAAMNSPVIEDVFNYYPLTQALKVGVNIPSLKNRNIYGGLEQLLGTGALLEMNRHRISELQGEYNGYGMLRTAALVPNDGTIQITVENLYDKIVFVNGATFGYKIAIGDMNE